MAPQQFLFVNKNASSAILSRSEADETGKVFRHVQTHLQQMKKERSKQTSGEAALALSTSTLEIIKSVCLPYSSTSESPSGEDRISQAGDFEKVQTWSLGYAAARGATSTVALRQTPRSQQRQRTIELSLRRVNRAAREPISEEDYQAASQDAHETPTLQYSICAKDRSIDPFNSTSVPITSTVHKMLLHFESMWYPRALTPPNSPFSFTSSGQHVLQECIFDDLQINCVLAIMSSRLENCYGHVIKGGSRQYIFQAIRILRERLSKQPEVLGKYVYAIMKLYGSEAYRSNLDEALIHLKGARALWSQLDSWTAIDPEHAPTLCGMTEVYFLPKVWDTPATFPTVADPGPAMSCFSDEILQEYFGRQEETAQALLAYLSPQAEEKRAVGELRRIVVDMIEYASARRAMSSRVYVGQPVPVLVTQWAHLRRFSFVFRLMSVDASKQPLLHAVRVALVIWLALVADFTGFERSLEIVATHLRDIVELIPKAEIAQHGEVATWILLLGAAVGDGDTRPWFVEALANSSIVVTGSNVVMARWFSFLETTSQRCLYCQTIQQQSLGELANEIYLSRCRSLARGLNETWKVKEQLDGSPVHPWPPFVG